MSRWVNKLVDKAFPEFAPARRNTVREMHAQGEAAQPGPRAGDVLATMEGADTAVPDATPGASTIDEATGQPVATPDAESPLRQNLGAPTAEQATAPLTEPLEPRTRGRNVNIDYLDVQNVDDIGAVLEANAARMDWDVDPVKSLDQTRKNVEGKQTKIFTDVLKSNPAALSDEQLLAGRDVLLTMASKQEELARKIANTQATADEIVEFDLVSEQAVMVQDYMQGKVRAAARALNSMKVTSQTLNTYDPARIKAASDGTSVLLRAQTVLDMAQKGDTAGQIAIAGEMSKFKMWSQAVVNLRSGALLTGPRTQMVNTLNNAFHGAYRGLVLKPVASAIGSIRGGQDRVYAREVAAELMGFVHGFGEAVDIGWNTWKHGTFTNKGEFVSMYGGRKIDEIAEDTVTIGSATKKALGMDSDPGTLAKGFDLYHRGVESISFGFLTAADDFFKTVAYRSTLYSEALREASRRGYTGDEATAYITDVLDDVSNEVHQRAMHEAERRTFTNREDVAGNLTRFADAIIGAGQDIPLLRWFFPFVRTPTAILDRSIKNSPFAPLQRQVRETIAKGGPEADMAIAEMAVGTAMTVVIASMAANKLITGMGPARQDDPTGAYRRTLRESGQQPNSVLVGDTYVSLKRGLDPTMLVPLAAAQAIEAAMYAKDEATAFDYLAGTALMIGSQFNEASFMEGMKTILDISSGRVNYSDMVAREAVTFVPALARDVDAVFRYASGEEGRDYVPKTDHPAIAMMMHLQAAVPFVEPPMVRRSWDGTVATPGGGDMMFLWNTVMPIQTSALYDSEGRAADPSTEALLTSRIPVTAPSSEVSINDRHGATVDLLTLPNGWELYDKLIIEVGAQRRRAVQGVVDRAEYRNAVENNEAGPNSNIAMKLSEALRKGKEHGTKKFMKSLRSSSFSWKRYGGQESEDIFSGAALREMMGDKNLGILSDDDEAALRDMGVRGMQTRENLTPPKGSGSDKVKRYDPLMDEVMETRK